MVRCSSTTNNNVLLPHFVGTLYEESVCHNMNFIRRTHNEGHRKTFFRASGPETARPFVLLGRFSPEKTGLNIYIYICQRSSSKIRPSQDFFSGISRSPCSKYCTIVHNCSRWNIGRRSTLLCPRHGGIGHSPDFYLFDRRRWFIRGMGIIFSPFFE